MTEPAEDVNLHNERDESIQAIQLALLEGMRCSSGMPTLAESPATGHERAHVEHVMLHSVHVMQWGFMRDAGALVDRALLGMMDEPRPEHPKDSGFTAEQWEGATELARDSMIQALEYLANEFRNLSDASLEGQGEDD